MVVRSLSWDAYLTILDALPQARGSRLTYDDGVLEITVPLEDYEFAARLIERFIIVLAELLGLPMKTMGSTTLNDPIAKTLWECSGGVARSRSPWLSKTGAVILGVATIELTVSS